MEDVEVDVDLELKLDLVHRQGGSLSAELEIADLNAVKRN